MKMIRKDRIKATKIYLETVRKAQKIIDINGLRLSGVRMITAADDRVYNYDELEQRALFCKNYINRYLRNLK